MEKAGTGGALFRNLYRDFLKESADLLESDRIHEAFLEFSKIAELWTKVASLLDKAGGSSKVEYIDQASDILLDLSGKEKRAMELLVNL